MLKHKGKINLYWIQSRDIQWLVIFITLWKCSECALKVLYVILFKTVCHVWLHHLSMSNTNLIQRKTDFCLFCIPTISLSLSLFLNAFVQFVMITMYIIFKFLSHLMCWKWSMKLTLFLLYNFDKMFVTLLYSFLSC